MHLYLLFEMHNQYYLMVGFLLTVYLPVHELDW